MAGRKSDSEEFNKSEFIRNILRESPKATCGDARQAWENAGLAEKFPQTLFYQVRGRFFGKGGGTGRRGRPRKDAAEASAAPMAAPTPNADFLTIERTLDKLVAQAEALRDNGLAEALRIARRRASSRLI